MVVVVAVVAVYCCARCCGSARLSPVIASKVSWRSLCTTSSARLPVVMPHTQHTYSHTPRAPTPSHTLCRV